MSNEEIKAKALEYARSETNISWELDIAYSGYIKGYTDAATPSAVSGLQWVKASDRMPELNDQRSKQVVTRLEGLMQVGHYSKIYGFEVYAKHLQTQIEWLDESSTAKPGYSRPDFLKTFFDYVANSLYGGGGGKQRKNLKEAMYSQWEYLTKDYDQPQPAPLPAIPPEGWEEKMNDDTDLYLAGFNHGKEQVISDPAAFGIRPAESPDAGREEAEYWEAYGKHLQGKATTPADPGIDGETWQEALRDMKRKDLFDDKFITTNLVFVYAFQMGFNRAKSNVIKK